VPSKAEKSAKALTRRPKFRETPAVKLRVFESVPTPLAVALLLLMEAWKLFSLIVFEMLNDAARFVLLALRGPRLLTRDGPALMLTVVFFATRLERPTITAVETALLNLSKL
jgi:hypothetical protein